MPTKAVDGLSFKGRYKQTEGQTILLCTGEELETVRKTTVDTLLQETHAWGVTGRRQPGAQGECMIVLDRDKCVALSLTPQGSTFAEPRCDLQGTTILTPGAAQAQCGLLDKSAPNYAPFVMRDFREYARERIDVLVARLHRIHEPVYSFPAPDTDIYVLPQSKTFNLMQHLRDEGLTPSGILKRIEIEYPVVKLGNWQVVGKLEAVAGGNLSFSVTQDAADVAALNERRAHPITCEHCKKNRQRYDGYLLRDSENGGYKQVGSSCLNDFTGHDPAKALFLARLATFIREAGDNFEEFSRSPRSNAIPTRAFLADVSFLTENVGFVSARKERESGTCATYSAVWDMPETLKSDRNLSRLYFAQIARHEAMADTIRAWVAAKPVESDFDYNVKLLLQSEAILKDRKHLAFAAASVPMYHRAHEPKREKLPPSQHVGEIGQKMTANLTVDRVIGFNTHFGHSEIIVMHDERGNNICWKTSACPNEIDAGRVMEATFTVKEHGDYQGKPQTNVIRLKAVRFLDQDQHKSQQACADMER